ncbi:MAG: hypothetical protein IV112_07500 [Methyloversatilis discipulorum]|uniref:hypothetical protein n=1 Tax=Methyloversatilis discipulorum TaxID=1119528 RepID=UPI0026EBDE67|nr:hypothetical protein [Methyloversatilis discipulorum]MBT9516521.1 hypothetical protein [Methyloversatilis discipulorum]
MKCPTGAEAVTTAQSEQLALDLRRTGASYRDIAKTLNMSLGNAHKLVKRGLTRNLAKCSELADEIRTLELDRLDAMQTYLWGKAKRGNATAVDRILKIMERRARLLGLDRPERLALGGDADAPPIKQETRNAHEFTDDELAAILARDHQQDNQQQAGNRPHLGD